MTHITATLLNSAIIRLDFAYDAATIARIKGIGEAAWSAKGRYWSLPIGRLDALIAACGDSLSIHPDVLAAKMSEENAELAAKAKMLAKASAAAPVASKPVDAEMVRQAALIVTGMHNAAANQYAEEAQRKGQKGRRYGKKEAAR